MSPSSSSSSSSFSESSPSSPPPNEWHEIDDYFQSHRISDAIRSRIPQFGVKTEPEIDTGLCDKCKSIPIREFLEPYDGTSPFDPRPQCNFTYDLLSEIASRSRICNLCRLISHAIYVKLTMDAGHDLPRPARETSVKVLQGLLRPDYKFKPEEFQDIRVQLRRQPDGRIKRKYDTIEVHKFRPRKVEKKDGRVVNIIHIHLFNEKVVNVETAGFSHGNCYGYLQWMMDPTEEVKIFPSSSSRPYFLGRKVPPRVRIPQIRRWLELCWRTHTGTCRNEDLVRGERPERMRVIDIKNSMIADFNSSMTYVTLSYCWGKDQRCKLLKSNIKDWMKPKGLPIEKMHKTIRDAITLAQELGIRYLWVDALCIVQDDKSVQADQISQMHRVYTSSWFTIMATEGADCDAGIPGVSSPRDSYQLITPVNGIRVGVRLPTLQETMSNATWNTRGWTYQELLLSVTKIYFTSHQMYFECFGGRKSYFEDTYLDILESDTEESFASWPISQGMPKLWLDNKSFRDHLNIEHYLDHLHNFILNYTLRVLTFDSDVYNAFQGIYNRMHSTEILGARGVVAGLPLMQLNQALLWHPLSPLKVRDTGDLHVPRWSWASHAGPIDPKLERRGRTVEIRDVVVITLSGKRVEIPDLILDEKSIQGTSEMVSLSDGRLHHTIETKPMEKKDSRYRKFVKFIEPLKDELLKARKLEFKAYVNKMWVGPKIINKRGVFDYDTNADNGHSTAPILDANGAWAGALRLPTKRLDEMMKKGEWLEVELVLLTTALLRDPAFADPELWMNTEETPRLFAADLALADTMQVLAVEEGDGGKVRWAVGIVHQTPWMRAKPVEEVVVLV